MRIYNNYVLSLALATCLLNTLAAFLGRDDLEFYFTINVIAYLLITIIYVYLNPRGKKALYAIGFALFGGLMIIVAFRVLEFLPGR